MPTATVCRPMTTRRAVALLALSIAFVLLLASPAFAHAAILESNPPPGGVLQKAPKRLTLTFSELVEVRAGAIRIYNSSSERVDDGGTDVINNRVEMPVPSLPNGEYVVTWRVVSADSHPVEGAFTFQIGAAGNASSPRFQGLAQRLLGQQGGEKVVGAAYGVTRGLVFAGLALLIGSTAFALLVWPGARTSARTARWVWAGWAATFIGSVGGLLLYGPYASGLGLGEITQPGLLGDTLDTSFGQVWLARVVLLMVAVPLLRVVLSRRRDTTRSVPRWLLAVAAALAVLLASTPALSGHAVTGDWVTVAVIADIVHVLAMSVWLGGLAVLATVLLPGRPAAEVRAPLTRWSRVALLSVTAIVVSGGFQTWRQVGSLDALRSTDYGRMLIVKLVLFAALVAVAAFSREIVLRMFPAGPGDLGDGDLDDVDVDDVDVGDEDATESGVARARVPVLTGGSDDGPLDRAAYADERIELRNLRRAVWVEVTAAMAILVVTALLVNAAPAKTAFAGNFTSNAVGVTLKSNKVWVDITITPGRKGVNDIHISTVRPDGAPRDVQDLTITFALPSEKVAPIKVALRKLGPGHYLAPGFVMSSNGTWRVTANVTISPSTRVSIIDNLEVGSS